jgi:hypothetical protein
MAGVVRHAGEVGLGKIEDASAGKEIKQLSHRGALQELAGESACPTSL